MFELEVLASKPTSLSRIPETDPPPLWTSQITAVSLLPWEEHCVECAMPACFKSCELYEPRSDGKCRRFKRGIEFVRLTADGGKPIVRVEFKRWARLLAYGSRVMRSPTSVRCIERLIACAESVARTRIVRNFSLMSRKAIVARIVRKVKHAISSSALLGGRSDSPTTFLIEVYSDEHNPRPICISMVSRSDPAIRFEQLAELIQGWNVITVDEQLFRAVYDSAGQFLVSIDPNLGEDLSATRTLYFATLAFVRESSQSAQDSSAPCNHSFLLPSGEPVKAVIWDLDNTLWRGTLVEDGAEDISPNTTLIKAVQNLDARGIVQSVASKNDLELAREQLRQIRIWDFFVHPQINWHTKSRTVAEIIRKLNIGPDTVLFVDDSESERAEVNALLPQVRCVSPREMESILSHPVLNPPKTNEAANRRLSYKAEETRQRKSCDFTDFNTFLKSCNLRMHIFAMLPDHVDRAFELVTRTNQLNFSGARLSRDELLSLAHAPDYRVFLARCHDVYGDYGTVGIAVAHSLAGVYRISNFALSCRVQSKKVEHYFLQWLCESAAPTTALHVTYIRSDRNKAVGNVLADLNAQRCSVHDDCYVLRSRNFQCVPQDLITVDGSASSFRV